MKNFKNNNKGFSLVEMIVAVAIFAIIMTSVGVLLANMSKSFSDSQREVTLQDNVQAAYDVISSLIKESQSPKKAVSDRLYHEPVMIMNATDAEGNPTGDKYMYIFDEEIDQSNSTDNHKAFVADKSVMHIIYFDKRNSNLYVTEKKYNPSTYISESASGALKTYTFKKTEFETFLKGLQATSGAISSNLLAQNVKAFDCDVKNAKNGYVVLEIDLQNGSRKASITENVFVRNSNTGISMTDKNPEDEEKEPSAPVTPITGDVNFTETAINNNVNPDISSAYSDKAVRVYFNSAIKPIYGDEKTETIYESTYKCSCGKELGKPSMGYGWGGSYGLYVIHEWSNPSCGNNNQPLRLGDSEDDPSVETTAKSLNLTVNQKVIDTRTYRPVVSEVKDGTLIIRNETQTTYNDILITLYFNESDSRFNQIKSNCFLEVDSASTTCAGAVKYSTSPIEGTKCKYIQISIAQLKGYSTPDEKDKSKKEFDQLVLKYDWSSTKESPTMCAYQVYIPALHAGDE